MRGVRAQHNGKSGPLLAVLRYSTTYAAWVTGRRPQTRLGTGSHPFRAPPGDDRRGDRRL